MGLDDAEEGVELSLLGEEERREALRGVENIPTKRPIGAKDKRGMVLLCVLCKSTRIARGDSL
jgi:PAT family acetyl-CoA transporter-like MFS transporter 1